VNCAPPFNIVLHKHFIQPSLYGIQPWTNKLQYTHVIKVIASSMLEV